MPAHLKFALLVAMSLGYFSTNAQDLPKSDRPSQLTFNLGLQFVSIDYQRSFGATGKHAAEFGFIVNNRFGNSPIELSRWTIYQVEFLYHYRIFQNANGFAVQLGAGYRSTGVQVGYSADGGYISLPLTLHYIVNSKVVARFRASNLLFGRYDYQFIPSFGLAYTF